ncbi:MAG: 50S ribosomal protein L3 [Thermotogae bacterium]|nr:50S ribosomal protein L3 [Thermotogota bacterium]
MLKLLAKKVGMTQVYVKPEHEPFGIPVPVTVLKVAENVVVGHRTVEKDGYNAVIVGYEFKPAYRIKKPVLGFVKGALGERDRYPTKFYEFRTDELEKFPVGSSLDVTLFEGIEKVDVQGKTKGRGFTGTMKRWDFSGGPAAHGSKFHRRPGSIGQHTYPGRVWKGKKMAGHYGNETATILNLQLVRLYPDDNILLVKGGVPGYRGAYVFVRPAVYKHGGDGK